MTGTASLTQDEVEAYICLYSDNVGYNMRIYLIKCCQSLLITFIFQPLRLLTAAPVYLDKNYITKYSLFFLCQCLSELNSKLYKRYALATKRRACAGMFVWLPACLYLFVHIRRC